MATALSSAPILWASRTRKAGFSRLGAILTTMGIRISFWQTAAPTACFAMTATGSRRLKTASARPMPGRVLARLGAILTTMAISICSSPTLARTTDCTSMTAAGSRIARRPLASTTMGAAEARLGAILTTMGFSISTSPTGSSRICITKIEMGRSSSNWPIPWASRSMRTAGASRSRITTRMASWICTSRCKMGPMPCIATAKPLATGSAFACAARKAARTR